jgi:hypothetical protein
MRWRHQFVAPVTPRFASSPTTPEVLVAFPPKRDSDAFDTRRTERPLAAGRFPGSRASPLFQRQSEPVRRSAPNRLDLTDGQPEPPHCWERSHSFRLVYPSLTLDQATSPAPSVSGFVVVSAVGGPLLLAALATLYAIALRPGANKERPEA